MKNRWKQILKSPEALDFPFCSEKTELTLVGRELLEIEGCFYLEDYEEQFIALHVKEGTLEIEGENLHLKLYHHGHLAIMGHFESLRFLKNSETIGERKNHPLSKSETEERKEAHHVE